MGDGDFSRWLRELERPDAAPEGRGEALRQAARVGRLEEALAAWAAARPPAGEAPIEADLVEVLVELGHGWGDPRLLPAALERPRVSRWADDPTGPTRLVVHDDLSWSRWDRGSGGLTPVSLPLGMPWSTGRGPDAIAVDAFMLAPGGTRALLAVTFTESPMLDAEEYAGVAVVDLAAREVFEATSPDDGFLFHAASPDLTGMVVGLYHDARLRPIGPGDDLPLPLPGRFMGAWPGPGSGEVTAWWIPEDRPARLDRVEVSSGQIRGPGLEVGTERAHVVRTPAEDTWVVWSMERGATPDRGRARLRWVDADTGEVRRELRSRVPRTPPHAVDAGGKFASFDRELRRLPGFRVVGRATTRGPSEPGRPLPVPVGPTLQEVDPFDGRLRLGAEAPRAPVWDVAVQQGADGPWLLAHGGPPGVLRGRALGGHGRIASLLRAGTPALDRPRLVTLPVAPRGLGWRSDLLDPRTGQRRPVRWRGRGGKTCGSGDVGPDGSVAMATTYAEIAAGVPEDPEPRWILDRQERRYSPALRWVGARLLVFFMHPAREGELVWLDGATGTQEDQHFLGPVGVPIRRLQASPGDAFLLAWADALWVVTPGAGPPLRLPVEDVRAACPLDTERLLVIDAAGTRQVFSADGTPGPRRPGPPGASACCALPGRDRVAVVQGAWIGFEPIPS